MGKSISDPNRISINDAAKMLRVSSDTLKEALVQNKLPVDIGFALRKTGGKNFTYVVFRNKVTELMELWGF